MMGKVIMSGIVPPLVAPVTGIQLGAIAEGSIVKLNESGSPVEFYVAKHDYESALNGFGRTLLVRKDTHSNRAWDSTTTEYRYAVSGIDTWLNRTYKSTLDADVQNLIATTNLYFTRGDINTVKGNVRSYLTTLTRDVFLLSLNELGARVSALSAYTNAEGTTLPISDLLKIAKKNGSATTQHTRTPYHDGRYFTNIISIKTNGTYYIEGPSNKRGIRPCFTFPSGACFDEDTMLFNGKIA